MRASANRLGLLLYVLLAAAATASAAELPCQPPAAGELPAGALRLAEQTADDAGCRIGSAALAVAPWSDALRIDLRTEAERQRLPVPGAMALRRSDLSTGLLGSLARPILLIGSGTDDVSLQHQCSHLAGGIPQPLAVLGGGALAWHAAQADPTLPAEGAQRLGPTGLVGLLADPAARLLVAQSALPEGLDVRAQLQRFEGSSARQLQRALLPLLAAAAREGGSVAVVLADSPDAAALAVGLSAPVRVYAQGPQPLLDWLHRQRQQLAERSPLSPETCRWN